MSAGCKVIKDFGFILVKGFAYSLGFELLEVFTEKGKNKAREYFSHSSCKSDASHNKTECAWLQFHLIFIWYQYLQVLLYNLPKITTNF